MSVVALAEDTVDFGDLPPQINVLLQQGVAVHSSDPARARAFFRAAIEADPSVLPSYRCLFKLQNKLRDFDSAYETALAGLDQAAGQAGLARDWTQWTLAQLHAAPQIPARFLLHSLKALAFIELRREHDKASELALRKLQELDPEDGVGGSVVAALLTHREPA
jgi:hypothetical protein